MCTAAKVSGNRRILARVAVILTMVLAGFGCDSKKDAAQSPATAGGAPGLARIQVGYIGLTCEAPLFVAQERGFFKEEGLDAQLTKYDWATYRDAIALGKIDITHHLVMFLLKPIEQGADLKITAGVHKGCLRVQTSISGNIHTIADLKGKRIGVPGLGTPPFVFATRVLANNGMDPSKDVTWRVFPASELGLAMQMGEVDAVGTGEPIGTLLESQGKVRDVFANATTPPYNDEYCCVVVCNGKFVSQHPDLAAGATRAILKACKWVQANPALAAHISVDGKFVAVNVDLDALALSKLQYAPSVTGGRNAVILAAPEMKKAGMLDPSTDVDALAARAFQPLDGVSDDILDKVNVEKVAGGATLPRLNVDAAMMAEGEACSCCTVARAEYSVEPLLPLTGEVKHLQDSAAQGQKISGIAMTRAGQFHPQNLLDPPGPRGHDEDSVAHVDRFVDVVRDQHHCRAARLPQPQHLILNNHAREGVERAKRLVKQQHRGMVHQRPCQRHTLRHAAGKLVRICGRE